jgi:hypothetical protein
MISLPVNFVDNLITTMGGTFTDCLPLVLFIGGITLAVFIFGGILNNNNKQ